MKIENFNLATKKQTFFKDVNFYFEDCQLNFVLGKRQSGKTGLLDQIAQSESFDNLIGFPKTPEIAYLAQQNDFYVNLKVKEILNFIRQLDGNKNFTPPLRILQLEEQKFLELSAVEKKLVIIYLNIMVEKELYLFDEPEMGLDLETSQEVFGWIKGLVKLDKTVIVATNKLDNISDIDNVNYIKACDEILVDSYLKIKSRMAF
ncbi:hypothetical protein C5L30_000776 [Companilactobacillus farciminis]|uniref:ABC transporter domain-containing protein n=1 Tax=Companilactobacillus farciminis TaxID=1612 RepID=A0A4R5ND26_9LACO|nr:cobalt ABC transporter ATPase [Companilactobacillus farciminis]ATO46799.1 hypothetical protein LF20184_08480 [Companilactobacillus farciminis KCTC 3681 = DSM 20184]KRK61234.1 ABC-type cobalt transport system, ATPase component [Companilactobacillus farciminis KCTC 3681 = DSM 20184]TDG70999.1 hypothetical protein C5L30_000776 [Companilactobacillus farciminis]